ncbi:Kazal serine protease inhibitor domain-containing protein [Phytophthora nicotianae]|uniref:Kazal serine protease inhibitor domain-containing protein n=1 Tax=Phytophthora nicotianae TaxID=4792 RepID=A0A0W8DAW3_PHYNI|nr:Kazal serine protease inhibitor domain-containing protein [Phytophthora nicotianae]
MGNENSTLSGEEELRHDGRDDGTIEGGECYGFRVLGIQEQSPASTVGFVSFFDFILEANGIRLDTKDATLMELIAQSEDRPMQLKVFNVKAQTTRELQLTPSRKWPGKGLLGVTIRFDSYEGAEDQLLHVLRVFADAEDLHDEILDALDGSFQCYVYNSLEDQVRIVSIVPTERWGGDGVLGAEVGHGYLHRLPSVCRGTIGSSVGFVNLPKDAKAATDAFLKPQRHSENSPATSREQENQDEEVGTGTQSSSAAQDTSQAGATQLKSGERFDQEGGDADSSSEATRKAAEEVAPPAKPRYTARLDHQFPISTVAVLADP